MFNLKNLVLVFSLIIFGNAYAFDNWGIKTEFDDFMGQNNVTARLPSLNVDGSELLVVRCDNNQTEAYVDFGEEVNEDKPILIKYDNKPPKRSGGYFGRNNYFFYIYDPINFIKSLKGVKKITFRYYYYVNFLEKIP